MRGIPSLWPEGAPYPMFGEDAKHTSQETGT